MPRFRRESSLKCYRSIVINKEKLLWIKNIGLLRIFLEKRFTFTPTLSKQNILSFTNVSIKIVVLVCTGWLMPLVFHGQFEDQYFPPLLDSAIISTRKCDKLSKQITRRLDKLTMRLKKTNDCYLNRFQGIEESILSKMCLVNYEKAEALIQDSKYSFNRYENKCRRETSQPPSTSMSEFNGTNTLVSFLGKFNSCDCSGLNEVKLAQQRMQKELKRTEIIKGYIDERSSFLNRALGAESEFQGALGLMNRESIYFTRQIQEYRNIFTDKSFLEQKVFAFMSKAPEFSQILNAGDTKTTFGSSGMKINDLINIAQADGKELLQSVQNGQLDISEVAEAKDEITKSDSLLAKSTNLIASDDSSRSNNTKNTWAPNPLKTKRIIDRILFSGNMQWDKRSFFLPLSGTIAGQMAYQFSPRNSLGIGASYIIGLGYPILFHGETQLSKFRIHNNGVGLRSFADFKIWKSFYLLGSFELNRREFVLSELNQYSAWTKSALIGLKFKYPIRKKMKSPTLEIMYDFIHQAGQPALVIRAGIEFKRKHAYKN